MTGATTRTGTLALYAALLLVGYPIEQIAFPELYGRIVDVIAKPSASPLLRRTWKYLVIATVLLMLSQAIFTWIDYLDAYLQPALESYYRENVLDGVLQTFERRYKDVEVGEIVSKLSKLPLIVRNLYHQVRAYMLPAVLVSAFACGYFAYLHWGLGLMLLVLLVVFFVFFVLIILLVFLRFLVRFCVDICGLDSLLRFLLAQTQVIISHE